VLDPENSSEANYTAGAAHREETSPVCKFFQGDNFFIPARSFLPTRWALGYLRAEFAPEAGTGRAIDDHGKKLLRARL
jgi:hypothetical protein